MGVWFESIRSNYEILTITFLLTTFLGYIQDLLLKESGHMNLKLILSKAIYVIQTFIISYIAGLTIPGLTTNGLISSFAKAILFL